MIGNELPTLAEKHCREYSECRRNMESASVCQSISHTCTSLKILRELGYNEYIYCCASNFSPLTMKISSISSDVKAEKVIIRYKSILVGTIKGRTF